LGLSLHATSEREGRALVRAVLDIVVVDPDAWRAEEPETPEQA
jgi:hypothetical protein